MSYPNSNTYDEGIGSFASFGSFSFDSTPKKKKFTFETYERKTNVDPVPLTTKQILSTYIPKELSMIHYWCGLFISSFMTLFSATDAVIHCNELYQDDDQERRRTKLRYLEEAYYDIYDEEEEQDIQGFCIQIFKNKILFTSIIGMILSGSVVTFLIRLNGSSQLKVPLQKAKVKMVGSNQIPLPEESKDSQEQREQRRQAPLLGFVAFLSSIVWGREISLTMLNDPWRCKGKECADTDDGIEVYVFRDSREDEITSLGAVNSMGEVGSNANLFYFSWISFIISISLCYGFTCSPFVHNKNSLDVTSNKKLSIYSYRVRMGTWISTTICCLVVVTASTRIWREIVAYREYRIGQISYDDDANELEDDFWSIIMFDDDNPFYYKFLPIMFQRTQIAIMMGLGGTTLSSVAIMAHWYVGQGDAALPIALWIELVISLIQFLLFGIAGWFVTGSGGPAQSVGVLYYATMATFLLSLRIFIGCVEEVIEAHVPVNISEDEGDNNIDSHIKRMNMANGSTPYEQMDTPSIVSAPPSILSKNSLEVINYRPGDLRRWAAIATFSSLNLGSVMDGINHMEVEPPEDDEEDEDPVDRALQWMIFAPSMAILITSFFFFLTLRPQTYYFVVKHKITLLGSMLTFGFWCSNLFITMHAGSSLAVNSRGEIITANQYYFSWASCATSFMNLLSYLNRGKPESLLAVLWSAILKISLVMISAAHHVWGNIRDDCQDDSIYEDSFHHSFCKRTEFALYAGYIGFVVSTAFLVFRICTFAHFAVFEVIASFIMMGLFSVGTYLITGIDGPGQVVGDLYYATWGVLVFSLVIGETSWDQFSKEYLEKNTGNDEDSISQYELSVIP